MARKRKVEQAYHCDMYYFNNVCPHRGEQDAADIRYRLGWTLPCRSLCKNFGLDNDDRLCPHCMENKKLFPPSLVKFRYSAPNGRVINRTPFQAKNAKAETIKAYSQPRPLLRYLKAHPKLYGVNVETGEIINVKVAV